jgi:hypothetical protein
MTIESIETIEVCSVCGIRNQSVPTDAHKMCGAEAVWVTQSRPLDEAQSDYERGYIEGLRRTTINEIAHKLHGLLGYPLSEKEQLVVQLARLTLERQETVARLRSICAEYGDNDWKDDLHLADVIDKHLANNLMGAEREDS